MAIKLYEKPESLKLAIGIVKEVKRVYVQKISTEISKDVDVIVVDQIDNKLTVGGGVKFFNKAKVFGFDLGLKIEINVNLIAGYLENEGEDKAIEMARRFIRHEYFHVYQYKWLLKHGGIDAVKKAREYESTVKYGTGPLERGAMAYENPKNAKVQNLKEAFAFCL